MDYMVSLHFIDFISWGILDNGPLSCITLWASRARVGRKEGRKVICKALERCLCQKGSLNCSQLW
jgi:hypothetical protein